MDYRGRDPQHDSPDPDRIVRPRGVVDAAPEPYSEKAADLVAEEDDPVEGREPGRSEDLGHHAADEGHRRQPADDEGPGEVEEAEEVLLAVAVAEAAEEPRSPHEEPRSPHVEQPHEGEGPGRNHLGEPVVARFDLTGPGEREPGEGAIGY